MSTIPTTSTTLLRDVARDSQHVRWTEFGAKYRPMMEAFMRERFPALEADDVIQETLVALCGILPDYRYEPDAKGHFRNYLTGILRNKARRALRDRNRQAEIKNMIAAHDGRARSPGAPGSSQNGRARSPSEPQLAPQDDDQSWRESLFEIALQRLLADESVADRTKRIFERTALNGESPEAVAESFKMTRHAVDQAKSRAMARLREMVKELESVADA